MRLPRNAAKVKHTRDFRRIVPNYYDAKIVECNIKPIPEHIRKAYNIQQTHSVNIEYLIVGPESKHCDTAEHIGVSIYQTLYPEQDAAGRNAGRFASTLSRIMGREYKPIFDTDNLPGIYVIVQVGDKKVGKPGFATETINGIHLKSVIMDAEYDLGANLGHAESLAAIKAKEELKEAKQKLARELDDFSF